MYNTASIQLFMSMQAVASKWWFSVDFSGMSILDSKKRKTRNQRKKAPEKITDLLGIFCWTSLAEMRNNLDTYKNYLPSIFFGNTLKAKSIFHAQECVNLMFTQCKLFTQMLTNSVQNYLQKIRTSVAFECHSINTGQ